MEKLFSKDHVWIRQEGAGYRIGLTQYAQEELGEIVFVELPELGAHVRRGDSLCSIDSLKSTSDVFAPVAGTVTEVNAALADGKAKLINSDPYDDGWIVALRIDDPAELDELLSEKDYASYVR